MNFLFKNELIIVINDKKDKLDLILDAGHFTTVARIHKDSDECSKNCSEGMQNRKGPYKTTPIAASPLLPPRHVNQNSAKIYYTKCKS